MAKFLFTRFLNRGSLQSALLLFVHSIYLVCPAGRYSSTRHCITMNQMKSRLEKVQSDPASFVPPDAFRPSPNKCSCASLSLPERVTQSLKAFASALLALASAAK